MNRQPSRRRSFLAALVCVVALGALVPPAVSQEPESIDDAKDRREEAREEQLAAQIELADIDAEAEVILAALEAANELVALQQAKIDTAQQRLDLALERSRQIEADITAVGAAIDAARARAAAVAVESYIGRSEGRVETWLTADTATDAVRKVALLTEVGGETRDVLDQLRADEERRMELLVDAEASAAEADAIRVELDAALVELEAKKQVQLDLQAELEARKAEWEAQLDAWEATEAELTQWIADEEARIAAELEARRKAAEAARAAAAAAANTASSGGGTASTGVINTAGWTWPTSGGLGSGFGMRLHPILGYYRPHQGMDIGGANGQPIWAATEGVVIVAGWSGGFGNLVVIQHANGVTTWYAHQSSITVSVGDYVFTGDTIGYVGSTGLSTGPHLHFEVRVNGVAVDPRPYLP